MAFRSYLAQKTITAKKPTATLNGTVLPFQTKLTQASAMLIGIGRYFSELPLRVVTDSGSGNESLWKPMRQAL
ncbi:MAG: IS701 family transposase, partial [Gammaproteobacteria bacterium]